MLRINVNRVKLIKSLQIVQKAISDNKIRPIIGGVYISAKDGSIFLRGTDLELTIDSVLEGEIISEGEIVISYQLLEEYLKEIGEENIEIIEDNGKIIVETIQSKSEFSIYDVEEYPRISLFDGGNDYSIDKTLMIDLMEKTKIAASVSPERLAVNCIRLEIDSNRLKMIASDTYRMAYSEEELEGANFQEGDELGISVPLHTIESLIKILKVVDEENVGLRQSGNQVLFLIGGVSILSRVIDLAFPDYKNILGNSVFTKKVAAVNGDFISVLKRVLLFVKNNTEAKNSAIFNFVGNKLKIRGVSETAKVKEELEILKEGDDLKISLNVKYILDFITFLDGNVEMNLNTSGSAVLLQEEGKNKFIYLTMPLALREE